MPTLYAAILLVAGLLFLGAAGFLIANAKGVANLIGKCRRDADPLPSEMNAVAVPKATRCP